MRISGGTKKSALALRLGTGLSYAPRLMDSTQKRKERTGRRPETKHGGLRHEPASRRKGEPTSRRTSAPERRSPGAKIIAPAARAIRSGHPWVFRDALHRPLSNVAPDAVLQICDADGYHLGWGLYEPEGAVALRIVGRSPNFKWDEAAIAKRLDRALAFRERLMDAEAGDAYRLIHGEADGFPGLAVDRLGDFLLLYKYSRCAESYLDILVKLLAQKELARGIYMQDRVRPVQASERRPAAIHMAGETAPPEYEVTEDGLRFVVDVTAPVSPGLFLDLREGRREFEKRAAGKRVLNLFSFTGAFGVRAVRAGAKEVVNVDSAARSHARCRQNLTASGFDAEACEALNGDVFKHLERLRDRGRRFDLVVVDPPPFSKVDGNIFSALKDWARLMRAVADVVETGGEVLAVCNAATLSGQEFLNAIGEGLALAKRRGSLIAEWGLPPDFPVLPAFGEGRYLKVKLLALD